MRTQNRQSVSSIITDGHVLRDWIQCKHSGHLQAIHSGTNLLPICYGDGVSDAIVCVCCWPILARNLLSFLLLRPMAACASSHTQIG